MSKRGPRLTERDRIQRCPKHLVMGRNVQKCDDEIWKRIKKEYRPYNVFVNVPYVPKYNKLQATIIATLMKVGLVPYLASLRSRAAPYRLCKLCEDMQKSKYCVTDVSVSHLHNMPFELGYFLGLERHGQQMILIDRKFITRGGVRVSKFDAQFSDLSGVHVIVHDNNQKTLAAGLIRRIRQEVREATLPTRPKGTTPLVNEILISAKRVLSALKDGTLDEVIGARKELIEAARRKTRP